MISQTKLGIAMLSSIVIAGSCFAQSAAEATKYYHLDFVVKEVESGKVINARSYSTTISTGDTVLPNIFYIRTGNKVPVPTDSKGAFTYVEVGVNIDCRSAREVQDQLALNVAAEISSAATDPPSSNPPLIRQTKWSSNVIVPIRKPTMIFSSDDPTTKRQTQLELTAIPIK